MQRDQERFETNTPAPNRAAPANAKGRPEAAFATV